MPERSRVGEAGAVADAAAGGAGPVVSTSAERGARRRTNATSASPATPTPGNSPEAPFWRVKSLDAMTPEEWESLCDGCARCCLVKLEDEDSGEVHFTDIGCKLLDAESCRCLDYRRRRRRVPDCVGLTPEAVRSLSWLPATCAYRVLAKGGELAWWHPLVSRSPETVHQAGVSVRGRVAASELDLPIELWPDHIARWPNRPPRRSRR
jgi:uncharacterized cysteine cluster protein YcgN (CxxCxxCC family)